jgi:hypothetical protein
LFGKKQPVPDSLTGVGTSEREALTNEKTADAVFSK